MIGIHKHIVKQGNKGFTLLEVVISVAALSLISIFIIQMFLASSTLNARAKNTDIALARAITEIDMIKSGHYPPPHLMGDGLAVYFGKNWSVGANVHDAYFAMDIVLSELAETPGLYLIEVEIWELKDGIRDFMLLELTGQKYYR